MSLYRRNRMRGPVQWRKNWNIGRNYGMTWKGQGCSLNWFASGRNSNVNRWVESWFVGQVLFFEPRYDISFCHGTISLSMQTYPHVFGLLMRGRHSFVHLPTVVKASRKQGSLPYWSKEILKWCSYITFLSNLTWAEDVPYNKEEICDS